ncbi:MAG: DUF1573 domain-containing protein [Prevotellaceae bacterium]|jgi:hypothetical protein|nr:DUF1573 domain-containing protein [Prevotellaceae bacterium]
MKKIIILLTIACATFTFVQAQTTDTIVKFDELIHNFGEIPQGVPATYSFEFTNNGDTPVTIVSVQASCGCTTPGWTKEAVAPGERGFVKATYNAAAQGNFDKSLTVKTDSNPATIVLRIRGKVATPVAPESK